MSKNNNENTRKTVVKVSDEMKTPEETVMKNPKKLSQKNRSFLSLELESSVSSKYTKSFFRVGFFIFQAVKVTFWNIRET